MDTMEDGTIEKIPTTGIMVVVVQYYSGKPRNFFWSISKIAVTYFQRSGCILVITSSSQEIKCGEKKTHIMHDDSSGWAVEKDLPKWSNFSVEWDHSRLQQPSRED